LPFFDQKPYQACFVLHLAQERLPLINQLLSSYVHYLHSRRFPSHASFCIVNGIFLIGVENDIDAAAKQSSKTMAIKKDARLPNVIWVLWTLTFGTRAIPSITVAELFGDPSASWTFFRS